MCYLIPRCLSDRDPDPRTCPGSIGFDSQSHPTCPVRDRIVHGTFVLVLENKMSLKHIADLRFACHEPFDSRTPALASLCCRWRTVQFEARDRIW